MDFQKFLETEANGFGLSKDAIESVNASAELTTVWLSQYRDQIATKVVVTDFGSGNGVTPYGEIRDANSLSSYASALEALGEPSRSEKSDFRTIHFWDK